MTKFLLAGIAATCAGAVAAQTPTFVPVNIPNHVYDGGWEHFVGGGLSAFDCNGDGLPEMIAAGGSAAMTLFINQSEPAGDLRFAAQVWPEFVGVTGAYPLDIDSDGVLDLAILRAGQNQLLRGLGDCAFEPFTDLSLATEARWSTAFSATWEQGQSLPTLAVGNYVDREDPEGPFGTCDSNRLYRPDGVAYGAPMVLEPGFCPLSMLFSDWSGTGRADLRVSNDRHYYVKGGSEQMWAMETPPRLLTQDDGWVDHALWGMGIASRDITGDGRQEVYLTSMADQKLQQLVGDGTKPTYRDVPFSWGTTAHRPYTGGDGRPSTGWHVAFGDVQNNGYDDVFITKGNVQQMPDAAMDDPNNLLINNGNGTFAEVGDIAGIASMHRGRGGVMADLNGDGRLDLAVNNRRAALEVWQNVTPDTGNWIAVSLSQSAPNPRAVGSLVEVCSEPDGRCATREITVGGGHAGGLALPEHFGLGNAATVKLRVKWGHETSWSDWQTHQPNQTVVIAK